MTNIEKKLVNIKQPFPKIDTTKEYKYIKGWIRSNLEISGTVFNYYTFSSHLRGIREDGWYISLGQRIYSSLKYNNELNKSNIPEFENSNETYLFLGKQKHNEVCNKLSDELNSLPNFVGKCYRFVELDSHHAYSEKIKKNDLVMDYSFMATNLYRGGGKNLWGVNGHSDSIMAYYIIECKTGKLIEEIANNAENEILFNTETIFKVNRIINYSNKTFYIYMTEISEQHQVLVVKDIFTGQKLN